MSAETLPTFVPGRELELVAGHARADDLADDRRLDPEVAQRLDERLGRALGRLAGLALVRARAPEDARVGQAVVGVLGSGRIEERRRLGGVVVSSESSASATGSSWSTSTGWRCGVSLTTSG